jgi:hypothetical protein
MKYTKDLSWLSAPAFILIIGMIFFSVKKQPSRVRTDKVKTENVTGFKQK